MVGFLSGERLARGIGGGRSGRPLVRGRLFAGEACVFARDVCQQHLQVRQQGRHFLRFQHGRLHLEL